MTTVEKVVLAFLVVPLLVGGICTIIFPTPKVVQSVAPAPKILTPEEKAEEEKWLKIHQELEHRENLAVLCRGLQNKSIGSMTPNDLELMQECEKN